MILYLKKIFLLFSLFIFFGINLSFADDYIYYYGNSCSHCEKVSRYMKNENILEKFSIIKKEVYNDAENREELLGLGEVLGLSLSDIGVPFLYDETNKNYYFGESDIIEYFNSEKQAFNLEDNVNNSCSLTTSGACDLNDLNQEKKQEFDLGSFFKFLSILLPAALSDSINPCAFAVLFLLMSSILSRFNSFKKAIFSGLLFCLAIFISYFLMGVGLYKVFSFTDQIFYLKIGVGVLGILVGLANIKDYFWYGKGFVMEVPFAWRKNMKKIIGKVVSPIGAFFVGFVVSLFLLPCTSGPYFTILGYLASESSAITTMGYIYMFIYNLIFILPMIIITLVIGLGVKDIAELKELKETHKENIHLIVGILMLFLGFYLIFDVLI